MILTDDPGAFEVDTDPDLHTWKHYQEMDFMKDTVMQADEELTVPDHASTSQPPRNR